MNYTKHQIIRIKELDRPVFDRPSEMMGNLYDREESPDRQKTSTVGFYEVLFQKGTLNFLPGTRIRLYNSDVWFYVASGIKEPWTRLIISEDRYPRKLWGKNIKIGETLCMYPGLLEDKSPCFVCSGESIAVPLSYISNFPDRKPEIVYLGNCPSLEFLKARSNLKEFTGLEDKNYYLCGDGTIKNGKEIYS